MLGRMPDLWCVLGKWQLFPHIMVKRLLGRGGWRNVLRERKEHIAEIWNSQRSMA